MKFVCNNCVDEGAADHPCVLKIKGIAKDNERDDWEKALRRCPFENTENNKFTGVVPRAHWERVKK